MIWDKLSPFYDLFEKLYNGKVFRGIAVKIQNYVNEEDEVLECACGTGLLSVPMAQKCKRLVATDYSEGMLKQAQRKLKKFSNVSVKKMSIFELPYDENTFDVVVAANVIHLLDQPEAALQNMIRVCKPGGRVVIPTYINGQERSATFGQKLIGKFGVDFKREFDYESYRKFFADLGYADVTYKNVEGRMPCCFAVLRK